MSPWANRRPCPTPGCPALTGGGPCPAHARGRARERGSPSSRGYGRHHQAWRAVILARDPLCLGWPRGTHPATRPTPATIADHVIPLRTWATDPVHAQHRLFAFRAAHGQPTLHPGSWGAWSLENGAGLCVTCHARKSREER